MQYEYRENRSIVDAIFLVRRIASKAIEGTRWRAKIRSTACIAAIASGID